MERQMKLGIGSIVQGCYFVFIILYSSLGFCQSPTDSSQTVIFDGYKGFEWGTKLEDFLVKKGCGNTNGDCIENVDKKDICGFRFADIGDEATYKKLMALGISIRDIALSNYLGKNCKVLMDNSVSGQFVEKPLPEVFDSVFVKSEGVVYFFINKE